jgi:hypothetical protein
MPPPPLIQTLTTDAGRGLRYNFHAGQMRAWHSPKRFVLVLAGTQSGKTSFGPLWLHREIQQRGPGDYMVVTPTYPLLNLKALPEFLHLFRQTLDLGDYNASSRTFVFRGGDTRVYFGHASDPDSLESATAKAAWLDEAGQKKFRLGSWEAIQRRLSIHQGRALLTTTPYDLGWLKQRLFDPWKAAGQDHPDIDVVSFESVANPCFPRVEYDRARRELPRWRFDLFYRAKFTRPAGLIYDSFDPDRHVRPPFTPPPRWPRYLGLDFGGQNTAGVFLAEDDGGTLYAYREYGPAGGRTAARHADALVAGEPGLPIAAGGAKSEQQWRDEFGAAGLPVAEPDVADVEVGINRVWGAFQAGRLVVCSHLTGLLAELGSYSRVVDEAGSPTEAIEDKNEYHLLDALRYIVPSAVAPPDGDDGLGTVLRP